MLTHPPLHFRTKILNKYYENIQNMDEIDALVIYKNSMQNIYYRYNPHIRRLKFDRQSIIDDKIVPLYPNNRR